jgi:peptidyl-tRNA hydrolase, PTH1 family
MDKFCSKNLKVIVGLGNPGNNHQKNRHNIGFRVIDELSLRFSASWYAAIKMEYAQVRLSQDLYDQSSPMIRLIKPTTYMNDSGKAVLGLRKKGIKPEEILVIHDELEKSFGSLSVVFSGSARGHNGLRSIIDVIGKDFWRLRFGIGRPENKDFVGDYVLSNFSREEELVLPELMDRAIQTVL